MSQVFMGSFWTNRWYITGRKPQRIVRPSLVGQLDAWRGRWSFVGVLFPCKCLACETRFLPAALARSFSPYIHSGFRWLCCNLHAHAYKTTYNLSTFKPMHFPGPKGVSLTDLKIWPFMYAFCRFQLRLQNVFCSVHVILTLHTGLYNVVQSISPILYTLTLPSLQPV